MKKWKIVAIAMTATLALGGTLAGGFFAGNKYAGEQYAIIQAEQENKLQDLELRLSSLNDDLKAKEAYIKELETAKKKLQSQYDELLEASDLDKQELERLTGEIFDLQQQLETVENDKKSLQEQLKSKTDLIEELTQQLETAERSNEDLQAQLSSKTSLIEQLQQRLQEKEKTILEMTQKIADLTQQVESYKSQLEKLQSEYSKLESQFNDLSQKHKELSSQSVLDKQQIQELSEEVRLLTNNVDSLKSEIERLENLQQLRFDLSYTFGLSVSEMSNSGGTFFLNDQSYSAYDFKLKVLIPAYTGYSSFKVYGYFYDTDGNMVEQFKFADGGTPAYPEHFYTQQFTTEKLVSETEYFVQLRFVVMVHLKELPVAYLSDITKFTYKGNEVGYNIVFKSKNPIYYGKE